MNSNLFYNLKINTYFYLFQEPDIEVVLYHQTKIL